MKLSEFYLYDRVRVANKFQHAMISEAKCSLFPLQTPTSQSLVLFSEFSLTRDAFVHDYTPAWDCKNCLKF